MNKKRVLAWIAIAFMWFGGIFLAFEDGWRKALEVHGIILFGCVFVSLLCYGAIGHWPWEDPYEEEADG